MNLLATSIIFENVIIDSYFYFLENKEDNKHIYCPTSFQIQKFNKIVDYIKENFSFLVKLELIYYNKELIIRVRKENMFVSYKLFSIDDNLEKFKKFFKKSFFYKKEKISLINSNYNLVLGRYAEKMVHEWLTHPAEDNLNTNIDFILENNNEISPNSQNRLTNIYYKGNSKVNTSNNWLYLRYVNKGFYSSKEKKVKISVKEAFMKKNGLVQSVCPFSCSFNLIDLNNSFKGVISKSKYSSGFFCTKNNLTVFGKVESGYLIFKNIKVAPEDNYYE